MPKWLKFVLNFFAVVTALGCFWIVFNIFTQPHVDMGPGIWLLIWIFIALHRVPIMLGEFIFLRPYLSGQHVNKEICKINIYVVFSLVLSSILCAVIFLSLLTPHFRWTEYLFWGLIVFIAGLVALAEVYIKTDYFIEKHLTTHPKKAVQLLSAIIISVYLLFVAGCIVLMKYNGLI